MIEFVTVIPVTGMDDRRDAGWAVLAGVAGAVVLAFVGAPQSLDLVSLVGLDDPDVIGAQFAVASCGAVATAAAVLPAAGVVLTGPAWAVRLSRTNAFGRPRSWVAILVGTSVSDEGERRRPRRW